MKGLFKFVTAGVFVMTRVIQLAVAPVFLLTAIGTIITALANRLGRAVDRRRILETVWEPNFFGRGKTLDFHVATLRRKLGDPRWIENRRGVGFRLAAPARPAGSR